MAITYISGSGQDVDEVAILGHNINLGQESPLKSVNNAPGDRIKGHDTALGRDDEFQIDYRGSLKDRAPNEPSGYSILGVPTYGDGKLNNVTTWAQDRAGGSSGSGSLTFITPIGRELYRYAHLSS